MNKILLSFDIEEFDLPEEYGVAVSESEKLRISREGTMAILDTLDRTGATATFFVTGKFAKNNRDLIVRMAENHEIASHGMDHSVFELSHLAESRLLLEQLSGKEVTGYRMARLANVSPEEILNAGYLYDSSKNPVWLPGRYNNFTLPLKPYRESCGLVQFPISAMPLIRFPLFWLSFKNLPLGVYGLLADLTLRSQGFLNLYTHPWEYQAESRSKKWKIPGYITRHAGKSQQKRLENLILHWLSNHTFLTFSHYRKELFG